ncbi:MAG: hypothetical protein ACKN9U_19980, partial [Pirellulaceae bacterium]
MKLLMSHFARLIPVVAAVFSCVAGPLAAQSVFPDKALEAAVRKEVFAKRFNEEPITADDVKNISQVVAKGKGI